MVEIDYVPNYNKAQQNANCVYHSWKYYVSFLCEHCCEEADMIFFTLCQWVPSLFCVSFFNIFLKLIMAYWLLVIYAREDNDSNA